MSYSIDQLVDFYVQTRDRKSEIDARYKKELEPVNQLLEALENQFLDHMQQNGMTSFATPAGTPYMTTHTSVKVVDWNVFFNFVMAHGRQDLLTHGANKAAVEAFMEDTKALPPGLDVNRAVACNVRRAK